MKSPGRTDCKERILHHSFSDSKGPGRSKEFYVGIRGKVVKPKSMLHQAGKFLDYLNSGGGPRRPARSDFEHNTQNLKSVSSFLTAGRSIWDCYKKWVRKERISDRPLDNHGHE